MPRTILIDEMHLGVLARKDLPESKHQAIRRTLDDRGFQADLRRIVREMMSQYLALGGVRLVLWP
jgi:hypothetical protein